MVAFYRAVYRGWQRLTLQLSGTRVGSAGFRVVLPVVDRLVVRVTRGRWNFTQLVIPTLILTTTGHRSVRSRQSPLCYVRDGDDLVVVGTNWGQEQHPAWTENLLASPRAEALLGGHVRQVVARPIDPHGADWLRLYAAFERMGPNYTAYLGRVGDRVPRMFRLTSTG